MSKLSIEEQVAAYIKKRNKEEGTTRTLANKVVEEFENCISLCGIEHFLSEPYTTKQISNKFMIKIEEKDRKFINISLLNLFLSGKGRKGIQYLISHNTNESKDEFLVFDCFFVINADFTPEAF